SAKPLHDTTVSSCFEPCKSPRAEPCFNVSADSKPSMRKSVMGVAIGVVLLVVACTTREDALQHVRSGDRYVESDQYGDAIVEYRRAVQLQPLLAVAHSKLAEAYARTNNPPDAIKEAIRAADLLPADIDAQIKAGS